MARLHAKELPGAIISGMPAAFPKFENLGIHLGNLLNDMRKAQAVASSPHPLQDGSGLGLAQCSSNHVPGQLPSCRAVEFVGLDEPAVAASLLCCHPGVDE